MESRERKGKKSNQLENGNEADILMPFSQSKVNGFTIIELNESEEKLKNQNISENKYPEISLNRREEIKLKSISESVENYYIENYGKKLVNVPCIICLLSNFMPNELLVFNAKKDVIEYIKYSLFYQRDKIFFNLLTANENLNKLIKINDDIQLNSKYIIPKTICKSCFIEVVNSPDILEKLEVFFEESEFVRTKYKPLKRKNKRVIRSNNEFFSQSLNDNLKVKVNLNSEESYKSSEQINEEPIENSENINISDSLEKDRKKVVVNHIHLNGDIKVRKYIKKTFWNEKNEVNNEITGITNTNKITNISNPNSISKINSMTLSCKTKLKNPEQINVFDSNLINNESVNNSQKLNFLGQKRSKPENNELMNKNPIKLEIDTPNKFCYVNEQMYNFIQTPTCTDNISVIPKKIILILLENLVNLKNFISTASKYMIKFNQVSHTPFFNLIILEKFEKIFIALQIESINVQTSLNEILNSISQKIIPDIKTKIILLKEGMKDNININVFANLLYEEIIQVEKMSKDYYNSYNICLRNFLDYFNSFFGILSEKKYIMTLNP